MKITHYITASIEHLDRCEDAFMVFDGQRGEEKFAPVFVVIDGMGGHQREIAAGQFLTGQDAAQKIRETLIADLERFPVDTSADPLHETELKMVASLERASHAIFNGINGGDGTALHERVGAVATVGVLCENGKRLVVTQVGDTRAYIFADDELIQICEDEDNVSYLMKQGALSEEDAERVTTLLNRWDGLDEPDAPGTITIRGQEFDFYMAWRWFVIGNSALKIPGSNVVVNALGTNGNPIRAQRNRIEILPGDTLLMCSDGVYKNLSESEIIHLLKTAENPAVALGEASLARSKDESNHRCNPDDITAVVVKF